jgi:uncharacterized membrane protein YbhN (UPF0104 family)
MRPLCSCASYQSADFWDPTYDVNPWAKTLSPTVIVEMPGRSELVTTNPANTIVANIGLLAAAAGFRVLLVDLDTLQVVPSGYEIVDFANGSIDFSPQVAALEVAQLLFATAAQSGPKAAVAAAAQGMSQERLVAALGYLQPQAIRRRSRRTTPQAKKLLTELRQEISTVCSVKVPKPVKIRRFGLHQLLTLVIVVLFLGALVPLLTNVDYAQIWASLQGADWWLVLLAVLMGQVAFFPQATAMMFAVAIPIPLRPATILQPAIAFISFAVPGGAGRAGLEASFLYKYGLAPAVAVIKGAIDGFGGFLVQAALLIIAFLTGALTIPQSTTDSGPRDGPSWVVIASVIVVAVAVVVVVLRIPKIRDRVMPQIHKAWEAIADVARSPKLALGLLGSQLVVQLLWGLALWLALQSLGVGLSLIACTAVVVATSLLQGIIPVPGGIGVSEAVMTAFLVPLGVSPDVAAGAAIIWRVSTFYLPATEGFFASRYLTKHGYLGH